MTPAPRLRPVLADSRPCGAADPGPPAAGHVIEPLLSIDDLARILNCSRRLVERMRSAGNVPRPDFQVGRCPRWRPETIHRWIGEGADGR
jgi:hypothetical protein